ncbi:hypothetical protein ABK040_000033 [Willaertia magna]
MKGINHLNWKDSEELNKEIFHIVCCKLFNLSFELIDTLDSTHEVDTYSSFDSHYIIKQNHYDEWNEIEEKEEDDKTLKKYKKKKRKVEYEEEEGKEEKYGLCVPTIEIWNDNFKESKSQFAKYSILNLNNILQCNPFKNNYIFPSSIKYLSLELSDFTAFGLKKKDRSKRKEEQIETVTDISKQFHPENLKEIIFPNVRFLRVYIEKPYLYNLAISTDDLNGGDKEEEMEKKFYKLSESIDLYFKHFVNRKLFPKVNHLVLAGLFDFDHVLQCDLLPHLTTLELNFSFSDVNGYYHDFWLDEKEKEELKEKRAYRLRYEQGTKDYYIIDNVKKLMELDISALQLLVLCVGLDAGHFRGLTSEKITQLYEMTKDKFVVSIAGTSIAKLYESSGE